MKVLLICDHDDDSVKVYQFYSMLCDLVMKSDLPVLGLSVVRHFDELRSLVDEKKKKNL